jgi:hypothetical protein
MRSWLHLRGSNAVSVAYSPAEGREHRISYRCPRSMQRPGRAWIAARVVPTDDCFAAIILGSQVSAEGREYALPTGRFRAGSIPVTASER